MDSRTEKWLLSGFTFAFLATNSILSYLHHRFEFFFYAIVISTLLLLVIAFSDHLQLPRIIIFGLVIHQALHTMGGALSIDGVRLYDYWLLPYLRWDNIVHVFGSLMVGLMVFSLVDTHVRKITFKRIAQISLIVVLVTMGVGAVSEIAELAAVFYLDAGPQVGDYMNNALDLVFNFIGAILAVLIILFIMEYRQKKKT
jgi:hypothetical protein